VEFQWLRDQQANKARNRPAASCEGGGSLLADPSSGWMRHLVFIAADCTAAARKADIVKTLRRWVRILCFKVGMIPALIACTAAGTVLRFIS
jgi:hypothetical protein